MFSTAAFAGNEITHDCDSSGGGCIVCDVADKNDALPAANDVTVENAAIEENGDTGATVNGAETTGSAAVTVGNGMNSSLFDIGDQKTQVEISVTDSDGNPLEGVHIQILDDSDKVVDEWDSTTNQPYIIEGLKVGVEFKIHVTAVPDGYKLPEEVTTFTIELDVDSVDVQITLEADPGHAIQIYTTTPATFEITYMDNGTLTSLGTFTTGKTGTLQIPGFQSGVDYTITFLEIPDGAIKPEPFTFRLTSSGVLDAKGIEGLVIISPSHNNLISFLLQDPAAGDNPQTGDDSSLPLWFTLAFLSGSGLLGTVIYGKKRRSS